MTTHHPGLRRSIRPGTLAIAALTTSVALLSPGMPVALADGNSTFGITAQPGVEQKVAAETSALQWGIRGSFVRYVSGATHILDGAQQGPNNTYLWPYQSTQKNPDTGEVTIQYGGTVNFMKYCSGETRRPNCDLDFTFSAPKIVLNPATGKGKLFATIHTKDYTTKAWSGPEERQIGNLDANAARFNTSGGAMHFSGVSATLTADGNAAFSNFYEEGGFLDSLSFTVDETFDVGERTGYNISNQIHTDVEFENSNRVFARTDGSILHVTAGSDGKAQLISGDLGQVKFVQDLPMNSNSPAAFDPRTNRLYWVQGSTIKTATVTDSGVGAATDLATFMGRATGFTYSPSRDAVAVLHNEGDYRNPNYRLTIVNAAGNTQVVALPSPASLVPTAQDTSEIYGSTFGNDGAGLRALPDGTFISLYDVNIVHTNGESEPNVPLHIKPDAAAEENVSRILEFREFMRGGRGAFRGITTDAAGNIGIYATFASVDTASKSTIGFARYSDGKFTVHPAQAHPDAQGVAALSFVPDGNAVFVSQDRSVAVFLDPTTMRETGRASLGEFMKDTASLLNDGAVFGADSSLYVIDRRPTKGSDEWNEYVGFQRLTPPGAVQQLDTTLGRYTMAGQAAEPGNSNSEDTTEEQQVLPPADTGKDFAEQAKNAAEEAKAAAEQAQQQAEAAREHAEKLAELQALVTKAEQASQRAERAAAQAEEHLKQAERDNQRASETLAEAERIAEQARKAADEAKRSADQANQAAEHATPHDTGWGKRLRWLVSPFAGSS
ncbi:HtaA domain-containing protein [Corynebacterium sp.]|uniref:HtaA domain-containing protein n=1 Tax=Corynebacterium sp. TaxID=1720 RepID=UPI0026DB1F49|nr:HtaA domain-containing protein [Corynebacterium sp.]MDO5077399.1 HtaA domain-containing protein [Corynebacterium sp.]